jgi:hypothetical protein
MFSVPMCLCVIVDGLRYRVLFWCKECLQMRCSLLRLQTLDAAL